MRGRPTPLAARARFARNRSRKSSKTRASTYRMYARHSRSKRKSALLAQLHVTCCRGGNFDWITLNHHLHCVLCRCARLAASLFAPPSTFRAALWRSADVVTAFGAQAELGSMMPSQAIQQREAPEVNGWEEQCSNDEGPIRNRQRVN
jgi:hypothetical protein